MAEDFLYKGPPKDWPQIQALRRIMRTNAVVRDLHKEHFNRIGIPIAEFDLLSTLGNTAGMKMSDLATAMITTPSNVTRICGGMEEQGLVERNRPASSNREVIASLTPKGEERFREVFAPTVNYSARMMNTGLSRAELKTLAELLDRFLAHVHAPDDDGQG